MTHEMSNFQSLAASLPVEGETCNLPHAWGLATQTETVPKIGTLIQKVEAASIAGVDRLMAELQELKNHLQSERARIEQEVVRYTNLTQKASVSTKIIFHAVSQWHPAFSQQKTDAYEVTAASTKDVLEEPLR